MSFECDDCGVEFKSKQAFEVHQAEKHELDSPQVPRSSTESEAEEDDSGDEENPWEDFVEGGGSSSGEGAEDIGEVEEGYTRVGVNGVDEMFVHGVPRSSVILLAGNPGSGKSILGLQSLSFAAEQGEKCLYMSFEEDPESLKSHMRDFGWDPDSYIEEDKLRIETYDPFEVSRTVEALFKEQSGELEIDTKPLVFGGVEDDFNPDRVVVDSLSAISAGFADKSRNYRLYVRELFNLFRDMGVTAFVIAESQTIPDQITETGQAEFLADGVLLMYKQHNSRGIQIYKMRGSDFEEKIAPMSIEDGEGINVRPNDSFFSDDSSGVDQQGLF